MENKNQVTVTANAFYGYIDDTTAYGKTIATQVQKDLKQLATMLNDSKLNDKIKREIYLDYANAIKEYIEKKKTWIDCCNCDCECEEDDYEYEDYDENEDYDEDEDEDDEEEEDCPPNVEDMDYYQIEIDEKEYKFTSYNNVTRVLKLLNLNNCDCEIWGNHIDKWYKLEMLEDNDDIILEIVDL